MKPAGFILRFIGFKCEKMSQRVILHSKDFPYLLNKSGSREYSCKDQGVIYYITLFQIWTDNGK